MDTLEGSMKAYTNGHNHIGCFVESTKEEMNLGAYRTFQDEDILALNHYYLTWFRQLEPSEDKLGLNESNCTLK